MRPLEVLFSLFNMLAFVSISFRRPSATVGAWILPFAAIATAAAQWLLEGPRWQLWPAYAVASGLPIYCLAANLRGGGARRQRPAWRIGRIVGAAFGIAALALATVLPLAVPIFRFPPPNGPYAIGTVTYHWVDRGRREIFSTNPDDPRELMVQLWYPAMPDADERRAPYVPDGGALASLARLFHAPGFTFAHFKYVATNAMPSVPAAPPAADDAPAYPVVIFSHGRGGFRQHNTFQVEALVSHGYIVAAIDHTYAAAGVDFPDGRRVDFDPRMLDRKFMDDVISYLAQDVSYTLDRLTEIDRADPKGVLTGRLDARRAGIFGLSMGGAIAAEACLRDARLRACLSMDNFMPAGVVRQGLRQPAMWITRNAETMHLEGWAQADIDEAQTTMRGAFEGRRADGYLLLIPGMFHPNFSDSPFYVAAPLDVWLGLDGPIDARRGHAIVNVWSLAFFDRHLKGAMEKSVLDGPTGQHDEVIFNRNK